MTDLTLHYINDPLCGWCYAAEPLVEAAAASGVRVVLHGGGLWEPATHASPSKRVNMRDNDARIARLTRQRFGTPYLEGTLFDPVTVWWSRPTIAAVQAAEMTRPGLGLPMMAAVQRAHYLEGRRVVEPDVLISLAVDVGLNFERFTEICTAFPVDAHIRKTHELMARHRLHGYPSFLLEQGATVIPFAHEPYYGDPEGFVAALAPFAIPAL